LLIAGLPSPQPKNRARTHAFPIPMHRSTTLVLVALALVVGAALLVVGGGANLFGRVGSDTGEVLEETALGAVDLARDGARDAAPDGPRSPDALDGLATAATASERAAVAAPEVVDPDAPLPIRGQVLDRFGAPVAGAYVLWTPTPERVEQASEELKQRLIENLGESDSDSIAAGEFVTASPWTATRAVQSGTRTDASGWFEIPGGEAALGGRLEFGRESFAPKAPIAAVHEDGSDHYLFFPARGVDAPSLLVNCIDSESGAAFMPEHFTLELVALGAIPEGDNPESLLVGRAFRTTVHPGDVVLSSGRVRVDRLAPGTWRFTLRGSNSGFVTEDVEIPFAGDDVVVRVEVPCFDTAWFGSAFEATGVDALAPDNTLGFADYPGDRSKWRPIGERRPDRQFLHTLRGFGTGPVSGAVLEIELEAASGMAHNDSINLEYRGEDGFAWGSRISALAAGGTWNSGARQTLFIDLGALTSREGHPPLLELLEDGALDVYVQDDTAVYGLELHVIP